MQFNFNLFSLVSKSRYCIRVAQVSFRYSWVGIEIFENFNELIEEIGYNPFKGM